MVSRLLTNNLKKVPLFFVNFNMKKFRKDGVKNSCKCEVHPALADDSHIRETLNDLCDYIRENYDMEELI